MRLLFLLGLALPCAAAPSLSVQAMPIVRSLPSQTVKGELDQQQLPSQPVTGQDHATIDVQGKPDPVWTKRMIRPCARSGNRMVC